MRLLTAILLLLICPYAHAQFVAPAPEDLIFYQIFLDRFNNGDPTNDDGNPRAGFSPANPGAFHGGDLEGIRQKLPYIRSLGANAIWVTPFLENVNSYHGYGAYNWYNVDPNFGDLAKLQQLCDEANDIGIGIYYDMVCNHAGDLIDSTNSGYPGYRVPPASYTLRWRTGLQYPAPFNSLSFFHAQGHIGAFNDPEQQLGELSGLDDLKTEDTAVRNHLYDIWNYWMTNTGVSGFRIDTVKHAEMGLWADFLPRLETRAVELGRQNFFTFGEIYGADDNYMRTFVGSLSAAPYKLDSALDFQYFYTSNDVFASGWGATANFINRLQSRASSLGIHHLQMPNFIDNHDVPRFLNYAASTNAGSGLAERQRRLELALVAMFTAPGPPIVYYGTEQDFDGGNDPFNREDMWDGQFESGPSVGNNFEATAPRYSLIKRLSQVRSALAPLRRGSLVPKVSNNGGAGLLIYSRQFSGSEVLMAMNTSVFAQSAPAIGTIWPQGQLVRNALDSAQVLTVGAGGVLAARTLPGQAAEIWVRDQDFPTTPPEVMSFSPADGSNGVATTTDITVQFSTDMDRQLTEAAIQISPATTGTVTWEAGDTLIRITPYDPLFIRSNYTVAVTSDAKSATQQPIMYPLSASWQTVGGAGNTPPLPEVVGALQRTTSTITLNGNGSEWAGAIGQAANTAAITPNNVLVWTDAVGDDAGPGSYLYPSNSVFTGGDADLAEFRVAFDATDVYLYLKVASVGASASFFTPYLGVALDVVPGGRTLPVGYDLQANTAGITDVAIRPDASPDYEVVFTGPFGARLISASGVSISTINSAYLQSTGEIEIRVPRSLINLAGVLTGMRVNLIPYTALETFGGTREVEAARSEWSPGGGNAQTTDPDVFDLAGASKADQETDLNDYTSSINSVILRSIIGVTLHDSAVSAVGDWQLY